MQRYKFLILLLFPLALGCGESEPDVVDTVPAEPAAAAETQSDVLIVDVRSQGEWDEGHHERAVHIPLDEVAEKIGAHADSKATKIVTYCARGGRAGKAKQELEELGYTNVENAGGLDDVQQTYP